MEIRNKKYMFALILLVLTLISASIVGAIDWGFRFGQSNFLNYFNIKMIINYIVIFSILFITIYFLGFGEKEKPKGTILGFMIAAIFAIAVALTIMITKGEPNFIWEISKLSGASWIFQVKTLVNALIVASVSLIIYNRFIKKEGEKKNDLASIFVIIVISMFVAGMVNYSAVQPTDLPTGVTYDANSKYVDRWLWQYPEVNKIKKFFLGASEGETDFDPQYGTYKGEKGLLRQGILKFGQNGAGLPAFFLGSLLLIWLFYHYKWFKDNKLMGYGLPIFLAGLLANEPSMTKGVVMSYAWWTALLLIRSSFEKGWGKDKPGTAFGLAFAIVETVYAAIIGKGYLLGSTSFISNFLYGIVLGFIWDLLMGKGGIWEATGKRQQALKERIGRVWEREGAAKGAKYALAELLNALPLIGRISIIKNLLLKLMPLEQTLKPLLEKARKTLEDLIAAERAANRPLATTLRTQFNTEIVAIRDIQRRISRLRRQGG
ncbi:hypothetical protein MBGDC06_00104 [Thermoplasmatales archaeon SCGC AB-539-C06]|nr:hypothetical protein MBGDC06_00104 [Thermoplasmatales archaeon SCGC AB-539-C06]